MTAAIKEVIGPRVPRTEWRRRAGRYLLPTVLLILSGGLLAASYTQPYWAMTLHAPQYPKGLHVQAYLNRLEGDVREIDGLNHYIGMRPLNEAAQLERETSAMMIGALAGLLVLAVFIHSRWAALAALPALLFPVGFLADLQFWLANFGTNLDPRAALSSSVKPFVPPVLGVGMIGQFKTVATVGTGFWLAAAASVIVLVALYFHRRAYKPLADLRRRERSASSHAMAAAAACVTCCILLPTSVRAAERQAVEVNQLIEAAADGTTLHVQAGVYRGMLVVNRPVQLIADGDVTIDANGMGDAVRITAPDVTLRGFHIRSTGDSLDRQNAGIVVSAPRATVEDNTLEDVLLGVSLSGAKDALVRGNRIRGKNLDLSRRGDGIRLWNSDGARVEDNHVEAVRDVVIWYSRGVRLVGNTVRHSRYGMHFMYANDGVVENNHLVENSVGIFLMYSREVSLKGNLLEHNRGPSGYGIGLKDMDGVSCEANRIIANRVGLYIDNSPSRTDNVQEFRRNTFAFNDTALAFLPAVQRNRFVENEFHENVEQVAILGSGELKNNDFTVSGRGNYWSDYAGFDADGDGLGDLPYRATSLFENLMDREPKLRLFLYSPAQQGIELASRAFPVMQPKAKITDEAPLMQPVGAMVTAQRMTSTWTSHSSLAVAALLISPAAWMKSRRRAPQISTRTQTIERPLPTCAPAPPATALASGQPIIRIQGLTKKFGRHAAVDGVNLTVMPGEAVALWGTNGAGKTTIIKCLLGLHACQGQIHICKHDARRSGRAARRLIGYVSQELSFYDDLTARETVRLFAALKGVHTSRTAIVLAQVSLLEHSSKRVCQLSGGMKQRLALAVALLADPPLLLLDEPTSSLDAAARSVFFDLLRELKRAGKTILFTTHRFGEVSALADRIVVLERGQVVRECPPSGFAPAHRLRLTIAAADHQRALDILKDGGFEAARNCTALLVRAPAGQNAIAIAHLVRAGINIESVEIESGDNS